LIASHIGYTLGSGNGAILIGAIMLAFVETVEFGDNVVVLATRLSDDWLLVQSLDDGKRYYVNPDIVTYA